MTKNPPSHRRPNDEGAASQPGVPSTNTDEPRGDTVATFEVFGTTSVTFATSEGTEDVVDAFGYMDRALEYYLLARYAYLHEMHSAFMINSFWAVEYALLAMLRLKFKTKVELGAAAGGLHSLTKYWKLVMDMVSAPQRAAMQKFESDVSRVQGHFKERYATTGETKMTYEGKRPKVRLGSEGPQRRARFDREAALSLSDFDHLMNFMFHDIAPDKSDASNHLTQRLAIFRSGDLYRESNQYSIAYPNKSYHGELAGNAGSKKGT